MNTGAEPSLLPGQIMGLAEAIEKRAAGVAELVRSLNKCETLDEVKRIIAQLLFENGFVRNEAAQLVAWCKVAKVTKIMGDHALPVPAITTPALEVVLARPQPALNRLAEDLVLMPEPLPIGAPKPHDWAKAAANDRETEEAGD